MGDRNNFRYEWDFGSQQRNVNNARKLFKRRPLLCTGALVASSIAASVFMFNITTTTKRYMSSLGGVNEQKRLREDQDQEVIPRLKQQDELLRIQAKQQHDVLIETLNGLKNKSTKEKLRDASEAMESFMIPHRGE
mmetsp:Transcript_465/g.547  ORF Transcript_465/g.547 Transcript_465/m.547 type:complete len:136 (-) Transcript_465:1106-1513(-)